MPEADDVIRYAFGQGPGRDFVVPLGPPGRPLTTSFGSLPARAVTDRARQLVWGTVDLLEATLYPGPCQTVDLTAGQRLHHALIAAFGLQRREPSNLFNDHRGLASVRSRFPVHAFVYSDDQAWFLDVYRHALIPVDDAGPGGPAPGVPFGVALAGRYTHLPSLYGRLRGPLVELELGIGLRSLGVALDLFGLPGELQLPAPNDAGRFALQLGLDPPAEWTSALPVALGPPGPAPLNAAGRQGLGPVAAGDDPTLAEVISVNRAALDIAARSAASGPLTALPAGLGSARAASGAVADDPDHLGAAGPSWGEVLWHRNAGRMPRHLAGMSGRRRRVASEVVTDAVAWLAVPPPSPLLQAVAAQIAISVCVQDADGFATGWYRVERRGEPRLELVRPDALLPARLEACYGHGLSTEAGCAVRHANLVWLLSADVPALVEAIGPGGWTLAQYACGWMAHGVCLAAAAHGLYARPSRAFDEILLQPVVGMAPGETVLLSVVSGTGRFQEPMLDLRT